MESNTFIIKTNIESKMKPTENISSLLTNHVKSNISLEDLPNELIVHIMSMISRDDLIRLAICSEKLFKLAISQSRKFLLKFPEDANLFDKIRKIGIDRNLSIESISVTAMNSTITLFNNIETYASVLHISNKVEFMIGIDHESMRQYPHVGGLELVKF